MSDTEQRTLSGAAIGTAAGGVVGAIAGETGIGLVIALKPVLGYEKSASIAREALKTGGSVYDPVLEKGWLKKEELDDMLRPENMTDPREIPI